MVAIHVLTEVRPGPTVAKPRLATNPLSQNPTETVYQLAFKEENPENLGANQTSK